MTRRTCIASTPQVVRAPPCSYRSLPTASHRDACMSSICRPHPLGGMALRLRKLANEMGQGVGRSERQQAAETDREAGWLLHKTRVWGSNTRARAEIDGSAGLR